MEQLRDALERAKAGDIDGFAFLVERFQDMAVGYSYAVLGDFHLAEDAAQEAFMEAYPNLHKVYGPEAFPSWLRRVVFKHCDRIRRRKTLSTTQGIPEEMFIPLQDDRPLFAPEAIGRVPGWVAHVAEQEAEQEGVLLRPRLLYDGPVDLPYTPIERRG